ncbi:MAG: MFS transporter [Pseudomonadota bacterium]|jgi:sugar phosphate permease
MKSTTNPWHIPVIFAVTFIIHHLDRNAISLALPHIAQEFQWSDREVGQWGKYLLSVFFLTYGLSQLLLPATAERFGAKRSLMLSIFGFSVVSILVGPLGGSLAALITLRLCLGLAESMHVPMMNSIIARHFSPEVRGTANSIWSVGLIIATALGSLIMIPLMGALGWREAFMVVGVAGIVVGLPLVALFVDDKHGQAAGEMFAAAKAPMPYRREPNYWLFVVIGCFNNFAGWGILGWLPIYFVRAKGVDIASLSWALSIVFTAGVLGALLNARIGDVLKKRNLLAAVGLVSAGIVIYLASVTQELNALVALFALALFCQSAYQAQEFATLQKLCKDRNVASATGTYLGIALIVGGVIGSMVPGAIVAATGSFDNALIAISGGAITAGVLIGWLGLRCGEWRSN